jgi:5-methylcytosine-specific restriction endonuclease McrA
MIKQKKKLCKSCDTEQYIFSKGLCKRCSVKPYKKIKQVSDKQLVKIEGKKEDTKLMLLVFDQFYKKHLIKSCEQCGKKITELRTYNVHHLLEKRNYPEFKFDTNNLMLLCGDCHSTYETSLKGDKIIERLNNLKEKYNL